MFGRGLSSTDVMAANLVATEGLVPDLTILLVVPANVGLAASDRGLRPSFKGPQRQLAPVTSSLWVGKYTDGVTFRCRALRTDEAGRSRRVLFGAAGWVS